MQLMMGGINGNYLTNITLNAAAETQVNCPGFTGETFV